MTFSGKVSVTARDVRPGRCALRGHELGLIEPGYLADLLLVDGNPLSDIRVLQDRTRLALIMNW